jgi:hypothetical protein
VPAPTASAAVTVKEYRRPVLGPVTVRLVALACTLTVFTGGHPR